jgi:hypothetical protein
VLQREHARRLTASAEARRRVNEFHDISLQIAAQIHAPERRINRIFSVLFKLILDPDG